jgi:hypothetical protein
MRRKSRSRFADHRAPPRGSGAVIGQKANASVAMGCRRVARHRRLRHRFACSMLSVLNLGRVCPKKYSHGAHPDPVRHCRGVDRRAMACGGRAAGSDRQQAEAAFAAGSQPLGGDPRKSAAAAAHGGRRRDPSGRARADPTRRLLGCRARYAPLGRRSAGGGRRRPFARGSGERCGIVRICCVAGRMFASFALRFW